MSKSIKFVIGALLTAALIVAVAAGVSTSDNNFTVQYNYFFGLNPPGNEVIATYGKTPKFETREQWSNWVNKVLPAVSEGLGHKISDKYFYPAGPLIIFGYGSDGFEATVLQNLTIEKPLMDEIYGIIDEEAKKRDIWEVPVKFVFGDFPRLDILAADDGSNEDTPPPDDPLNKNISDSDKASGKSVQGFRLLGGLISLLSVWLFRRR